MSNTPLKSRRLLAALGALALALSGVLLTSAPAVAISGDVVNTADSGAGSLRQAIINANTDPTVDTITIIATGTITLLSSLPQLTEPVSIVGPGADDLTINASAHNAFVIAGPIAVSISDLTIVNAGALNNIAAIESGGGPLTLSSIVVTDSNHGLSVAAGQVNATDVSFINNDHRGATLQLSNGLSTLTNVTTTGNGAIGLYVLLTNDATLTANGTVANLNTDNGILIAAADESSVTFTNAEMTLNSVTGGWSGLSATFIDDAEGTFTNTTASSNGWDGMRVDLNGRAVVTLTNTTANGNVSDGFDGTSLDDSVLTVTNTTTTGNGEHGLDVEARSGGTIIVDTATSSANGRAALDVHSRGAGGINNDASTTTVNDATGFTNDTGAVVNVSHGAEATILRSVFTANYSHGIVIDSGTENGTGSQVRIVETNIIGNGDGNSNGSGIAIVDTTDLSVVIFDSTIAHNTGNEGGGVYSRMVGPDPSVLTIVNSTISDNTAAIGGGMYLHSDSAAPISVHSATFADNTTTGNLPSTAAVYLQGVDAMFRDSILAGGSASDVDVDNSAIAVFYNSLIERPSVAATPLVSNAADDNVVGLDPQLGPLDDNGGFTLTRMPATTSPVVNAGDPDWSDGFITEDQRGEARVSGGRIDIGAVEVQQGLAATGPSDTTATLVGGVLLATAGVALVGYRRLTTTPR